MGSQPSVFSIWDDFATKVGIWYSRYKGFSLRCLCEESLTII